MSIPQNAKPKVNKLMIQIDNESISAGSQSESPLPETKQPLVVNNRHSGMKEEPKDGSSRLLGKKRGLAKIHQPNYYIIKDGEEQKT